MNNKLSDLKELAAKSQTVIDLRHWAYCASLTSEGASLVPSSVLNSIADRLEAAEKRIAELQEESAFYKLGHWNSQQVVQQLNAEIARRDKAAREPVGTKLVYSSVLPKFIGDTDIVESYSCFISGKTPPRKTMEEAYNDAYEVCGPLFTAAPPATIAPDGWIKCSDRMPDALDWVISYDEVGTTKAYIDPHGSGWIRDNGDELYAVTHWMPLPAAPGGE